MTNELDITNWWSVTPLDMVGSRPNNLDELIARVSMPLSLQFSAGAAPSRLAAAEMNVYRTQGEAFSRANVLWTGVRDEAMAALQALEGGPGILSPEADQARTRLNIAVAALALLPPVE
jgi:hypothetical protein